MVILNIVVFDKEEIDAVVNSMLKNKFALNVVVCKGIESFYLNSRREKIHSVAYTIQFATKSLLFEEIEAS